jgi:hypothetical protein
MDIKTALKDGHKGRHKTDIKGDLKDGHER